MKHRTWWELEPSTGRSQLTFSLESIKRYWSLDGLMWERRFAKAVILVLTVQTSLQVRCQQTKPVQSQLEQRLLSGQIARGEPNVSKGFRRRLVAHPPPESFCAFACHQFFHPIEASKAMWFPRLAGSLFALTRMSCTMHDPFAFLTLLSQFSCSDPTS